MRLGRGQRDSESGSSVAHMASTRTFCKGARLRGQVASFWHAIRTLLGGVAAQSQRSGQNPNTSTGTGAGRSIYMSLSSSNVCLACRLRATQRGVYWGLGAIAVSVLHRGLSVSPTIPGTCQTCPAHEPRSQRHGQHTEPESWTKARGI